jgi:NAD(P)-dependent dehydrogenase (short-subunit alcohol dehydrogenase family)
MNYDANKNVALVTGVSSGIGREIAQLLAERGLRVFGTVHDHPIAISGVELISLDVTSKSSVAQTVQHVLNRANALHVLVNNAGYALIGGLEETSIEEAQQQFDTNFFGVLRTTQAVLPAMRRQRFGRIVNISSVLGFLPGPYMGIYAATKHALEGYTETLDHEVRQFGVRALLVEPNFTKTAIGAHGKQTVSDLKEYADARRRATDTILQQINEGSHPRTVAEVVYQAITAERPRSRYPVGNGLRLSRLRRFAPAALVDRGLRRQFHLDADRSAP